jgi:hypothetical protein
VSLLFAVSPSDAQVTRVPTLTLSGARERHPADFSVIGSARELPGERVLVADQRERQIRSVRFTDQSSISIGRPGKGPKEFLWLGTLRAVSRDSTIFSDGANRRWMLLEGEHIVGSMPPDHPAVRSFQAILDGADTAGSVMLSPRTWPMISDMPSRLPDSSPVLLVPRKGGAPHVVATLKRQPTNTVAPLDGNWKRRGTIPAPIGTVLGMSEDEAALLCTDGRVAVARVQPFRVDYREPNGRWRLGAPMPIPDIPVDGVERAAYLKRTADMYVFDYQRPKDSDFPRVLPVFVGLSRPLIETPDGGLFVKRTQSARQPNNRYLVIDRASRLQGELVLPINQTIVGSGRQHVYLVETDEDDLQHLVRVRWTLARANSER